MVVAAKEGTRGSALNLFNSTPSGVGMGHRPRRFPRGMSHHSRRPAGRGTQTSSSLVTDVIQDELYFTCLRLCPIAIGCLQFTTTGLHFFVRDRDDKTSRADRESGACKRYTEPLVYKYWATCTQRCSNLFILFEGSVDLVLA